MTIEARDRFLGEWLNRINTHQVVLPRFQRFEAWGPREVSDLLTTVFKGLPAGSVLVLEVGDTIPFVSRPLQGAPENGERIAELLLDGQQRLTALWRSLNDNYPDKVYLLDIEGDESPQIIAESRWEKNGKRYPIWLDNPQELWKQGLIPVRLLRPDDDARDELSDWADIASAGDATVARQIEKRAQPFRDSVKTFNLPFLFLSVGTDKPTVINVFVKMNTRLVRLSAFDIIVAQVEQSTGESLHERLRALESAAPQIKSYIEPSDLVLTASALILDRPPNESGYSGIDDYAKVIANWDALTNGVKETVKFLMDERILDGERLPTIAVLAPLVALFAAIPDDPNRRGSIYTLLRKYIWRAFFTNRYEKAAASAALQDYRALKKVINGTGISEDVPIFNDNVKLPEVEELKQVGWPKKRDRLARAILCISLYGGARDIYEGSMTNSLYDTAYEYHHLYPVDFLADKNYSNDQIYRALNCALIKWRTNRKIGAKEPVKYLLEASQASTLGLGESEIKDRLKSHNINYSDLASGDYETFLIRRAESVLDAAKQLCMGRKWHP